MSERVVELSHELANDIWHGPPDAKLFKSALMTGAEIPGGPIDGCIAIVTDGIPEDAVVAGPVKNPYHRTYEYRVISEQWPEDATPWFNPTATWVKK